MIPLTKHYRSISSLVILFFISVCLFLISTNTIRFLFSKTDTTYGEIDKIQVYRFYSEIKYTYIVDRTVYQGRTIVLLVQPDRTRNGYTIRYLESLKNVSIVEDYIVLNSVILLLLLIPFLFSFLFLLMGTLKMLPKELQQRIEEWIDRY